jgi:hypothetical protein
MWDQINTGGFLFGGKFFNKEIGKFWEFLGIFSLSGANLINFAIFFG